MKDVDAGCCTHLCSHVGVSHEFTFSSFFSGSNFFFQCHHHHEVALTAEPCSELQTKLSV